MAGDEQPRDAQRGTSSRPRLAAFNAIAWSLLAACNFAAVEAEGEFGRSIALGSGDASALPRLAYRAEPCPGSVGGCKEVCLGPPATCGPDACVPLLIDSATAITMFADDTAIPQPDRTCFEVRSAAEVLDPSAPPETLAGALSRFRFSNTPVIRLPRDPAAQDQSWSWRTGTAGAPAYVGGILGGNVLRQFAVRFVHRSAAAAGDEARFDVTFYREFPGSEGVLADQGRAFIPLQFPGLLLGKDITDVCLAGGVSCDYLTTFDRERVASALRPTRMVLDACLGAPPATVEWDSEGERCRLTPGPGSPVGAYHSATGASGTSAEQDRGCDVVPAPLDNTDLNRGHEASLVVATGVAGLVLFEDSARRLLNDLKLPLCKAGPDDLGGNKLTAPACIEGSIGTLDLPGWPSAGSAEQPLLQVRVRSVALVPGLATSTGPSACQRLETRQKALKAQCDSAAAGNSPRLTADNSCAVAVQETAAIIGEAFVREVKGAPAPNPARWITTVIVPDDHPMVAALRRDVSPEALQPDGMIGTALFSDSDVVLDYTDGTPGVRVACFEPDLGTCAALPQCVPGGDENDPTNPACCFGLPEDLLISLIRDTGEYACCGALSSATVAELNLQAESEGREPPCAGS